jgi:histidine triad (HIT) family protein
MADTIFGKIIRGEVPCNKVYEDDRVLAFRDINPQAPVHILVIPKVEIEDVSQIGAHPGLMEYLVEVANKLAIQEGIAETGYRLVTNKGRSAGQSVDHLHLHLLGGRAMGWPPG